MPDSLTYRSISKTGINLHLKRSFCALASSDCGRAGRVSQKPTSQLAETYTATKCFLISETTFLFICPDHTRGNRVKNCGVRLAAKMSSNWKVPSSVFA